MRTDDQKNRDAEGRRKRASEKKVLEDALRNSGATADADDDDDDEYESDFIDDRPIVEHKHKRRGKDKEVKHRGRAEKRRRSSKFVDDEADETSASGDSSEDPPTPPRSGGKGPLKRKRVACASGEDDGSDS